MARWEVRTRGGGVQVEGANWLVAVGAALPSLGLDIAVMARLVCDVQKDGVVRILDPVSRTPFLVRQLPDAPIGGARSVDPVAVVASAASPTEDETGDHTPDGLVDIGSRITIDEIDPTVPPPPHLQLTPPAPQPPPPVAQPVLPPAPPPALATFDPADLPPPISRALPPTPPRVHSVVPEVPRTQPASFTAADMATLDDIVFPPPRRPASGSLQPPADLEELLFMRAMDIRDASDLPDAARTSLQVLSALIPCEASSVLYASVNDTSLRFLAAMGPSAHEVEEITVPLGHGIAGFCFDTGASVIIRNASQDPRHLHRIDEQTGFHTQELLSVAIRDEDGTIHGCIQLLNAPGGFSEWQLDSASRVAAALGEAIRSLT